MNFWQTFKQATEDTTKGWLHFGKATGKSKYRYYLSLPAFNVSANVWIGASYITTEFWLSGLGQDFTLVPKLLVPLSDVNFCLCVRWPNRNADGEGVVRYKLWEDVGERLAYPLYNGEMIDKDCVFEIWSSADFEETSLLVPYLLPISLLITPSAVSDSCCSGGNLLFNGLTQVCELFTGQNNNSKYNIPIIFNNCFDVLQPAGETFYRVTELGDIRSNESDDKRVWR